MSNLIVKLPNKEGKVQPQYMIASTERIWNLASEYQRLNALENSITRSLVMEFTKISKQIWKDLPMWTLRQELDTANIDYILAGMAKEEWITFRKKHILLKREKSNYYKEDQS